MNTLISGPTPDLKVVYAESDILNGRVNVPSVGDHAKYEDGSEFIFCSTLEDIGRGKAVCRNFVEGFFIYEVIPAGVSKLTLWGAPKAIVAGELAGCLVSGRFGGHFLVQILGNTGCDAGGNTTVTLARPLPDTIYGSTLIQVDVDVVYKEGQDVTLGSSTGVFCGVTGIDIQAATLGERQFFWVQKSGICHGYTDETPATFNSGMAVFLGDSGAFIGADDYTLKDVGFVIASATLNVAILNLW